MWIFDVLRQMAKPTTLLEAVGNLLIVAIALTLMGYGAFLLSYLGDFLHD